MIDNHGATGGDCFLNGGAAGFADEQVALTKQARKLIGPAQDVDLAIASHQFDCAADSNVMSNRDGQVDAQMERRYVELSIHSAALIHALRERVEEFDAIITGPRALPDFRTVVVPW